MVSCYTGYRSYLNWFFSVLNHLLCSASHNLTNCMSSGSWIPCAMCARCCGSDIISVNCNWLTYTTFMSTLDCPAPWTSTCSSLWGEGALTWPCNHSLNVLINVLYMWLCFITCICTGSDRPLWNTVERSCLVRLIMVHLQYIYFGSVVNVYALLHFCKRR